MNIDFGKLDFFTASNQVGKESPRWSEEKNCKLCMVCDEPAKKYKLLCEKHLEEYEQYQYDRLQCVDWDGKTPLTIFPGEYWNQILFHSKEEVERYVTENNKTIDDLRLELCKPEYLEPITKKTLDLSDDFETISIELAHKIEEINQIIKKLPPVHWYCSQDNHKKLRVKIK